MTSNEQSKPVRHLSVIDAICVIVGIVVGAGIYRAPSVVAACTGGAPLMIFTWLLGGFLCLCGALCYGELGAAMPEAGGEYIFLSKLYHPTFGFLSGWISFFVGFSAPIAASALGVSEYLAGAFPGLFEWANPVLLKKLLAMAVVIAFTMVHKRGIEFGTIVQNYLTVIKVALIVGLIVVGFSALVSMALVFMLSIRLRRREIETMIKIGGARRSIASILALEIILVFALGALCAGGLTALTSRFGPDIIRSVFL